MTEGKLRRHGPQVPPCRIAHGWHSGLSPIRRNQQIREQPRFRLQA